MVSRLPRRGREKVALRKESVDRNKQITETMKQMTGVALRKESVDRNKNTLQYEYYNSMSLSARRAWIEIIECSYHNIKLKSRSPQGERG